MCTHARHGYFLMVILSVRCLSQPVAAAMPNPTEEQAAAPTDVPRLEELESPAGNPLSQPHYLWILFEED